jgi:hypothetical protein
VHTVPFLGSVIGHINEEHGHWVNGALGKRRARSLGKRLIHYQLNNKYYLHPQFSKTDHIRMLMRSFSRLIRMAVRQSDNDFPVLK